MNGLTKSIAAAVTAAVLCTANTSAISANSYTEVPRKGVSLDNDKHWSHAAQEWVENTRYSAFGYDIKMYGVIGEPIECTWEHYNGDAEFKEVYFNAGKVYYSHSIIDRQGSFYFDDVDDIAIEYNMDIGRIAEENSAARWYIGAKVLCMRDTKAETNELTSELLGSDPLTYMYVIDKSENFSYLDEYDAHYFNLPEKLGMITSNGAEYAVWFMQTKDKSLASSVVYIIRKEALAPSEADNIPPDHTRYENSISITDTLAKLRELGLDLGGIYEAEFTFNTSNTSGSAYLNKADFKRTIPEWKKFTAEDIGLLRDYIQGKGNEEPECQDYASHNYTEMNLYEYLYRMKKDYDLNGDGVWDVYDLALMRKRIE